MSLIDKGEWIIYECTGTSKAAAALVHGVDDRVPPSESVILHRRLRECKKPSRLTLTPVITQGDAAITVSMISALFDLTGTCAFFF